ncbi:MAG: hypothetical protein ACKPE3_12915 [Sphaerospermopsis kisseleviana]
MLRKSFREGIGVRSQESGEDLKISLPSLEIPKNAHFFSIPFKTLGLISVFISL